MQALSAIHHTVEMRELRFWAHVNYAANTLAARHRGEYEL